MEFIIPEGIKPEAVLKETVPKDVYTGHRSQTTRADRIDCPVSSVLSLQWFVFEPTAHLSFDLESFIAGQIYFLEWKSKHLQTKNQFSIGCINYYFDKHSNSTVLVNTFEI